MGSSKDMNNPEKPVTNPTAPEKAAFKDWMNHHGVA
jgi:hypothetical protein